MSRQKYLFREQDDRLIRERYDSRTETIDWLARVLGMPRYTVRQRARTLALARTKELPWSSEDVAYLETQLHRLHVGTIAKHLGRTRTAVALKAKRLSIRQTDEGYTARSLAVAFGVDDHKVVSWIGRGLLKAARRHTERENDMYLVTDRAVREFVRTYPTEFDLRRVDQLWFIDLLTNGIGRNGNGP